MSIKELIARNQRGLPLSGKQPVYNVSETDSDEDAFHIAVNKMGNLDLAEREALQDQLQARIEHLKGQAGEIAKKMQETKEKALIAADEAKFKEFAEKFAAMQKQKETQVS